jgi:hypothetical protein
VYCVKLDTAVDSARLIYYGGKILKWIIDHPIVIPK